MLGIKLIHVSKKPLSGAGSVSCSPRFSMVPSIIVMVVMADQRLSTAVNHRFYCRKMDDPSPGHNWQLHTPNRTHLLLYVTDFAVGIYIDVEPNIYKIMCIYQVLSTYRAMIYQNIAI